MGIWGVINSLWKKISIWSSLQPVTHWQIPPRADGWTKHNLPVQTQLHQWASITRHRPGDKDMHSCRSVAQKPGVISGIPRLPGHWIMLRQRPETLAKLDLPPCSSNASIPTGSPSVLMAVHVSLDEKNYIIAPFLGREDPAVIEFLISRSHQWSPEPRLGSIPIWLWSSVI